MPPKKKKTVVTTETTEGEDIEKQEKVEPDEGYKRKTELPDIVIAILAGEIEECPPEFENWTMHIMRWAPKFTPDNKFELVTGRIREIKTLTSYQEVEEIIDSEHGGGTYHVNVLNGMGKLATRKKIYIEGLPKVTMQDMNYTAGKYPTKEEEEDGESRADYWRKKKEEYEAMMEAEEAKARYEKSVQDDDIEEVPTASPFFMPGAQPAGMGFGRPGMELVDRGKLEAEIEARVLEKYARQEDKRELQEIREELRVMREAKATPQPQDNGFSMKDVFKMFSDMTTKLVDATKQPAPVAPQSEEAKMSAFASMITGAMQNVNQMMMNTMQQTASAQHEILMHSIKNAMSPAGEKDWKLELIDKGADTVKEFVSSIVDANKSRHEVEKKKLDVIGKGKIRPVMLPRGMIKTGKPQAPQPQPPQPQPSQPQQPQPQAAAPEYRELPPEYVKQLMANANKLQQLAVGAYLSGQSPAFFARKTLDIAGQEVTIWLRENPFIESLRQIAFEQKGEAGLAEFDKYVTNNQPARKWVEEWLNEIVANFRPVDASGQPIPEPGMPETGSMAGYEPIEGQFKPQPPAPTPEPEEPEEEYVEIEDYEELPEPVDYQQPKINEVQEVPSPVIPEEALCDFVTPTPHAGDAAQEKSEKKPEKIQGDNAAPNPPEMQQAEHKKSPESLVDTGHEKDAPNERGSEVAKQENVS